MADIFLGYARDDRDTAERIASAIEAKGWSVWWDVDLLGGQDFDEVIERQLDTAGCVIVLWSERSIGSDFVRDEATRGREGGKLVPVTITDVRPPLGFGQRHTINLVAWSGDTESPEFVALVKSVAAMVGMPGADTESGTEAPGIVATLQEAAGELADLGGEGWVALDGGTFTMGSDDGEDRERPPHQVTLSPYRISRYPVTNRQYRQFVMETGKAAPSHWTEGQVPEGQEGHPVVYVSWSDAEAYCTWLTKKVGEGVVSLPTEAQWEFASRGAEGRTYPWGWEEPDEERANFGDPDGETTLVNAYPGGATPTGIYDLAGNTWEWCRDSYGPYSGDPITDPTGPNESGPCVLRGGSFGYTRRLLRAAYRRGVHPDVGYPNSGFGWCGGRREDRVFYVMPYVEGDTLKAPVGVSATGRAGVSHPRLGLRIDERNRLDLFAEPGSRDGHSRRRLAGRPHSGCGRS